MFSKKAGKSFGRFLGWVGLNVCLLITKIIPRRCLHTFANSLANAGYVLASKQRKTALESLGFAFGAGKSRKDIEVITRDCFRNIAKSAVEVLNFINYPDVLKRGIKLEGKEYLDAALSAGKGVILVSAHFGNFPLMLAYLSFAGYKVSCLMRTMRDSRAEKFFRDKRVQFNIGTIYSQPREACVEKTLNTLRNNEAVFILLDQNFGTAGVFVDFFGRQAATATGPVVFSMRTKAAILPCFIVRQKDNTHKIIFEPVLNLEERANSKETISVNIQRLTSIIESYIREYPAEWGWIHRRWKSQK